MLLVLRLRLFGWTAGLLAVAVAELEVLEFEVLEFEVFEFEVFEFEVFEFEVFEFEVFEFELLEFEGVVAVAIEEFVEAEVVGCDLSCL
jgi:hypothetical protein